MCMYVCVYIHIYVCMYVCMYVCIGRGVDEQLAVSNPAKFSVNKFNKLLQHLCGIVR